MNNQKSLSVLLPSKGLTLAAKDHANTQSLTDKTGHTGTDGSDLFKRMKKYGSYSTAGENISYGSKTARKIVVSPETLTVRSKIIVMNEFYNLNQIYVFKRDGNSEVNYFSPVSMFFREERWTILEMFEKMKEIAEASIRYYLY